jgi:hypothetical protein
MLSCLISKLAENFQRQNEMNESKAVGDVINTSHHGTKVCIPA